MKTQKNNKKIWQKPEILTLKIKNETTDRIGTRAKDGSATESSNGISKRTAS